MTRLHAKAWIFHRRGETTAYIGSSNLTHTAQVTGLEWNVRVASLRATRTSSQDGGCLRDLLGERRLRPVRHRRVPRQRTADRHRAHATCSPQSASSCALPRAAPRAHRRRPQPGPSPQPARGRDRDWQDGDGGGRLRPPLDQRCPEPGCSSSPTARRSSTRARRPSATPSRDGSFGELWVRGQRPTRFEHVFASIQSLNAAGCRWPSPPTLRCGDRRRVSPCRRTVRTTLCSTSSTRRAPWPHRHPGTSRRSRRAPLLRWTHRSGTASVGRDRSAVPGAVSLLRHPRWPRPDARCHGSAGRATTLEP